MTYIDFYLRGAITMSVIFFIVHTLEKHEIITGVFIAVPLTFALFFVATGITIWFSSEFRKKLGKKT